MQYAQVIIDKRTRLDSPHFTYAIRPEQLAHLTPGALIEVPFGQHKALALVKRLTRSAPEQALKTIHRVINTGPLLPNALFQLAEQIADYYLQPISQVLFGMLPPLPKKQPNFPPFPTVKLPNASTTLKINQPTRKPASLLIAPPQERFLVYTKLIADAIAEQQSVLLLVPDTSLPQVSEFITTLTSANVPVLFLAGNQTTKERFSTWATIRSHPTTPRCVIGSFQALFAPLTNLGLIIVDDEANRLWKSEQQPYLHVPTVARFRSTIEQTSLLYGATVPSAERYLEVTRREIHLYRRPHIAWPTTITTTVFTPLVDGKEVSLINPNILTAMIDSVQKKEKVACFVNRLRPRPCDQCGKELHSAAMSCPQCGKTLHRLTVHRIQQELRHHLPDADIRAIYSGGGDTSTDALLLVGTSKLVGEGPFALGIICLSELNQSLPDFRAEEHNVQALIEFMSRCQRVYIQSTNPNSRVGEAVKRRSVHYYLQQLLIERAANSLPPYQRLISLVYTLTNATGESSTFKKHQTELQTLLAPLGGSIISANQHTGTFLINLPKSRSPRLLKNFILATHPSSIDVDPYRFH